VAKIRGHLPSAAWLTPHPELRGVFVGGCVERGVGSSFRATAHAHSHGFHRGFICFRSDKWLHVRELWLHELAHVVTRQPHNNRWREFLLQIGGTLDPVYDGDRCVLRSYHPRTRHDRLARVLDTLRTTSQVTEAEASNV
jgi:hypothetical protein